MSTTRDVYVISDLHLGGVWQGTGENAGRGFRMMTRPDVLARFIGALAEKSAGPPAVELVINGDFIDFLAEEHEGQSRWVPFVEDPDEAVACFRRVAEREGDSEVFDALKEFVARGHALTILLGNHDVELSLPPVRRALEQRIGAGGPRPSLRFLYDGEAYEVGDALIEHGNRYDPVNVVTHDALRRLRSLQSRRQFKHQKGRFDPPAGSSVVAGVMNPLKVEYPFIDLLKPESEPLYGLIMALEPGYKGKLSRLAKLAGSLSGAVRHRMAEAALPAMEGDIASDGLATESFIEEMGYGAAAPRPGAEAAAARHDAEDDELRGLLSACLRPDTVEDLLREAESEAQDEGVTLEDIGLRSRFRTALGLAKLVAGGNFVPVRRRLRYVRETLRALDEDRSFEQGFEAGTRYRRAAEELSENYSVVVFGHTHHAKKLSLESGATYLNSGTWANLMRFPASLFDADEGRAVEALKQFFDDMRNSRLENYVEFHPTYVRLEVDERGRTRGELFEYAPSPGGQL